MDCVICKRKLKGLQRKFCGDFCAVYHKIERARILAKKRRKKYPPKFCIICKNTFKPIRRHHVTCSKDCRSKLNIIRTKEKRHARGLRPQVSPMSFLKSEIPENLETHKSPVFNSSCSENKNQILDFIKKGGEITIFPSAPAGKTPAVNRAYAWIPDELFGSALLYEMGDEDG